jgi:hypothetical protein
MPRKKANALDQVYQLKITLWGSKPQIWRRVLLSEQTTLHQLHWIIQGAMGWTNSHLHQFIIGDEYYSLPEWELGDSGTEFHNEKKVTLQQLALKPKESFSYEYDFGDTWAHIIRIEKQMLAQADVRYPVCVDGKRACPPEDCGGVWGYEEFLKAIRNANHPEHEDMLEWVGGSFDPEHFSLAEANQNLRRMLRLAK